MAVSREAVAGVISCVQDVVRNATITQRSFFSDSGVVMLNQASAFADSVIVIEEYNPWSVFGDGRNQQPASSLQSCQEKVALRRKASRDTNEP